MKYLFLLLISLSLPVAAATVEEARQLSEDGDTDAAIAMLMQLQADEPRNSEVPLALGELLLSTGKNADAQAVFSKARTLGNREATRMLAELACIEYRVDDARNLLDDYRKALKKGKKQLYPDNSGDLDDRIDRTDNMLGRVEQIEVIDSLVVDADDFFRYYRLSPESGSLNAPDAVLPRGFAAADPTVVFEPESRREIIWAAPDSAGTFSLVSSSILYGDEWDTPVSLGDNLGEGGDANYPFLMPDGITLYFANDGENSLGGLDIFISRRGDDGFLQPQNLGMPYNSPFDDYMLAIDEVTGIGWWATDRNRIPGKVTIYMFVPQELRKNVDPDDPSLRQRALLSSIAATQQPGTDRAALLRKVAEASSRTAGKAAEFTISIPGRGVYTSMSDFRSPEARKAMQTYMENQRKLEAAEAKLAQLRRAYAGGDRSVADSILQAENRMESARAALTELRNRVVTLER